MPAVISYYQVHAGPAPESAGPNARPRRGAPLSSGVIRSSCSINRTMTFLMEIFSKISTVYENKKTANCWS